jgi:N-methylhydantoinase A
MRLDKAGAEAAIEKLADRLGMSLLECASGITKIAEFNMADIIRRTTVGKGYDPRDFVLFAFGGAGPVHAGVFARELGVQKVIVPQRETASTWCAFGAASADILHVHERVDIIISPFAPDRVAANLERLAGAARTGLLRDGVEEARHRFEYSLDMRHKGQINEVEVVLDLDPHASDFNAALAERFYARYEQLYGHGSSFRGARLEIVTFRVRAMADTPRPNLRSDHPAALPDQAARRPSRQVYWDELKSVTPTDVYDGSKLRLGELVQGPAIVETQDTSVVVRPGQQLVLDTFGNFELTLDAAFAVSAQQAGALELP